MTVTGLREQKRAATQAAIEESAITLVDERGLDAATVEEIARRADISPRTFFNYFSTKEEALLGRIPEDAPADVAARFLRQPGSTFDALEELIAGALLGTEEEHELDDRRRIVLSRYPDLTARRMASLKLLEQRLTELVEQRLRAGGAEPVEGDARMMTFIGIAAVRHAWHGWAASDHRVPLRQQLRASFVRLRVVCGTASER